ncbi:MAG: hypothetical protein F7C32_00350 [Desulfurococcales archaeon]|nr:hypothetical protein [Desulfurococcales archaeon]
MGIQAECSGLVYLLGSYHNHLEQLVNGYLKLFAIHTKFESADRAHLVKSNLWNIVKVRDALRELLELLGDSFYEEQKMVGVVKGVGTSVSSGSDLLCCIRLSKLRDIVYEVMTNMQSNNVLRAFYGQALIVLRDIYRILFDITNKYCKSIV